MGQPGRGMQCKDGSIIRSYPLISSDDADVIWDCLTNLSARRGAACVDNATKWGSIKMEGCYSLSNPPSGNLD